MGQRLLLCDFFFVSPQLVRGCICMNLLVVRILLSRLHLPISRCR